VIDCLQKNFEVTNKRVSRPTYWNLYRPISLLCTWLLFDRDSTIWALGIQCICHTNWCRLCDCCNKNH